LEQAYVKLLPNADVHEYVIPVVEEVIRCDLLGDKVTPDSADIRDAAAFLACKVYDIAPTPAHFVVQLFEMLEDQVRMLMVVNPKSCLSFCILCFPDTYF
jgi:hypothetical protein